MAGAVLIYFPDDLLARVDRIVTGKRKLDLRNLTRIEVYEANRIAKTKGEAQARKFIDSLDRSKKRGSLSRVRLITELVEIGLKYYKTPA